MQQSPEEETPFVYVTLATLVTLATAGYTPCLFGYVTIGLARHNRTHFSQSERLLVKPKRPCTDLCAEPVGVWNRLPFHWMVLYFLEMKHVNHVSCHESFKWMLCLTVSIVIIWNFILPLPDKEGQNFAEVISFSWINTSKFSQNFHPFGHSVVLL